MTSGSFTTTSPTRPFGALVTAAAIVLLSGCDAPDSPSASTTPSAATSSVTIRTKIDLPPKAGPVGLAFSANGDLWVTETSVDAIARITPSGDVTQSHIPGESNSPSDIIEGPDGQMWFTGFQLVGRIDDGGRLTGWENFNVGLPDALTVGEDGAVWYTNQTDPPRVSRIGPDNRITHTVLPEQAPLLYMGGIVTGADGALWFTMDYETEPKQDAIGRLTTSGDFSKRTLPPESDPGTLTAGPDGALWFTTTSGIGRMPLEGSAKHFPLPDTTLPRAIITGPDHALWFTTEKGIGRVTVTGEVKTWPVPGADGLMAATFAADGSLWITDSTADTILNVAVPS